MRLYEYILFSEKGDKRMTATSDFNSAAAKKEAPSPRQKILDAIEKTRRNLNLHEAIKREDWQAAADLAAAGADPMHRSHAAVDTLNKNSSAEAQRLAETLKTPGYYHSLQNGPLMQAARSGNIAAVEDYIARNEARPAILSRALEHALEGGQDAVADLLLKHIPLKEITDVALNVLNTRRPAAYGAALEGRPTERGNIPDFIGHFYYATEHNDHAAMDRALGHMIAHKDKLPLYTLAGGDGEYDPGGAYSDLGYKVLQTGDIDIITRLAESYGRELPRRVTLLHIAAGMTHEHPAILQELIEALKPTTEELRAVMTSLGGRDAGPAALWFLANQKELVKENPQAVLTVLASLPDANALIDAVDVQEIPLPKDEKGRARLIATAIERGNKDTEIWLLARIDLAQKIIGELQGNLNFAVQKRVAELGKTMRFNNDSMFWNAVQEGERAIVDAFPREPKISTDAAWRVGNALGEVVKRGDMALFRDIIRNSAWTETSKKQVFRAALDSQAALEIVAETGFLPEKLEEITLHDIVAKNGPEKLAWLEKHGVRLDGKLEREALRLAIHKNAPEMIEYLMSKGAEPEKEAPSISSAIDYGASLETMTTLEKWMTRGQKFEAPGIKDEIAAAENLFAGDNSVAIRAAYADSFAAVMKKAAATPGFNIDLLAETKDSHGNSVLDILGAHGKLNDVLAVPVAWKNRDAVSFIEQNTPKPYHAQVDYNPLKAALDLMRLQERGRDNRFKLK